METWASSLGRWVWMEPSATPSSKSRWIMGLASRMEEVSMS